MKIIHTSDWHLGQNFMFKDRRYEHESFLDWLFELIKKETPDALVVAGDIFDTISPPNYALKMYYGFLARVSCLNFCDVIIVGGNHDSVSVLNAPKGILEALNVHVVGGISEIVDDEVIVVSKYSGVPESVEEPAGIICAVPFLRDRDIRKSLPGESYSEKSQALLSGINKHYIKIKDAALKKRADLSDNNEIQIPIIATGHLFAAGGHVHEDEGVREIYVGSLGQIAADTFPDEFTYLALGHLHRPQKVGGKDHIRYSGAPIPLSFSEAGNEKQVICVEFCSAGKAETREIPVPEFRRLRAVSGTTDEVLLKMQMLRQEIKDDIIWLEISIDGETWKPDTKERIYDLASELSLDIFAVKNTGSYRKRILKKDSPTETLDDYTPETVFQRRLEREPGIGEEGIQELMHAFNEIMVSVKEAQEEVL